MFLVSLNYPSNAFTEAKLGNIVIKYIRENKLMMEKISSYPSHEYIHICFMAKAALFVFIFWPAKSLSKETEASNVLKVYLFKHAPVTAQNTVFCC